MEQNGQTGMKKAVAIRLLNLKTALPAWIVADYKMVNAAELLHVYLAHGYVLLARYGFLIHKMTITTFFVTSIFLRKLMIFEIKIQILEKMICDQKIYSKVLLNSRG